MLHQKQNLPEQFRLTLPAKQVEIQHQNGVFSMAITGFSALKSTAIPDELAQLTGLSTTQILSDAYYMNAGVTQLIVQVSDPKALRQAHIDLLLLRKQIEKDRQHCHHDIYLWCKQGSKIHARMYFEQDGILIEDSGTGSAAANLGAYFIHRQQFPCEWQICQGDFMHRPNRLALKVDENQQIFVGGKVIEVGEGVFYLPESTI